MKIEDDRFFEEDYILNILIADLIIKNYHITSQELENSK